MSVVPPAAAFVDSALAVDADDASDSVVLVCAPPLLLTVTPGATRVLEDVVPDVFAVAVAVVPVPVGVDPLVDVEPPPVVIAVDGEAVPVDESPDDGLLDVEPTELDEEDDSEDVPVVSAAATP